MAEKKSRQKVTAEDLGADIIRSMDAEFHDASDRVLAIVGAAYLDSVLEQLLRAAFLDDAEEADRLLAPDRAIGANGARYQLAYCLRLISADQRDDLKTIAKIRNLFAHKYAVRSFDDEEPGKYLATLHYAKQREAVVKDLMATERDPRRRNGLERASSSRRRMFQDAIRDLFVWLLRKSHAARRADPSLWYGEGELEHS